MRLEARFVFRCCRIRRIPVGRRLSRLSYGRNRPHGRNRSYGSHGSNRRNRRNWSHGRDWSYGSRPHGRNGFYGSHGSHGSRSHGRNGSYGSHGPHGSNRRNRCNGSNGSHRSHGCNGPHGRNGCCKLREGERGIGKNIEQILQKYVDTPTMRKEYEIEGEGVIVTRHFTAQERLNELIFQLAVRCTDEERDEGTGRTKCDRAWEE